MSERKAPRVIDRAALLRQKEITRRIRENNDSEYQKTGKTKHMHIITFGCP